MKQHQLGDIVIRPASEADAATIAAIHTASWRDAYADILTPDYLSGAIEKDRLAIWSQRFRDHDLTQLVNIAVDTTGQAQGFICSYCDADPVWGSLVDNLHVLPQLRGYRIGERLLRAAARELAERASGPGLHLWVFEANAAAVRFYQRLGGEIVERDVSEMPAAGGKPVLRVRWRSLAQLG
jgi:ribosomal protein S18 acetylase RimI-like enzyme